MASNKVFNLGPVALTTTMTTNILNPAAASGGVNGGSSGQYIVLRHIRILNKGAAATFSLWRGATGANAAGTEVVGTAQSVAANSAYDWYGAMRFDTTDFLVGGSDTATRLTLQAEGEVGVA